MQNQSAIQTLLFLQRYLSYHSPVTLLQELTTMQVALATPLPLRGKPISLETRWPLPCQWTYEDYLRLPDDGKRYEIIDGALYMSSAPSYDHQFTVSKLDRLVGGYGALVGALFSIAGSVLAVSFFAFWDGLEKIAYVAGSVAAGTFLLAISLYTMTDDDSSPPPSVKPKATNAYGTTVPRDNWSDLRISLCNYQQNHNNQQARFKQLQQEIGELEKAISILEPMPVKFGQR